MADPITAAIGHRPGKIIAVHVNYRSRAAQLDRVPAHGSYFLKAASSIGVDGGPLVRPAGTELLGFEGEIALVIGRSCRTVAPAEAWGHVGWVTAANDAGLHDLRYADRGSNLRSKSGDGYTPLGPVLLDAATLDPAALRVRTWLNGVLAQSDDTSGLLFPFAELIADLARTCTLDVGDVILTGTPAGASVAVPGDVVEVEVDSLSPGAPATTGRLRSPVVEGPALTGPGAPPKVDAALRDTVWGRSTPAAPDADGDGFGEVVAGLRTVAVATISVQLRRRGLDSVAIEGVHSTRPGARFAGRARTLRYLPLREDLVTERTAGFTVQKRAVDTLRPGEVLVMEARAERGSGTIGDILALRAQVRGAAAIVTDGGVRDAAAIGALDIPVFSGPPHPAVLGRRHLPWDLDVPIGCGNVTVLPGDVVVGDDDGVVVVPAALAREVLADAREQERQEQFITEQVRAGESVDGLYPLAGDWVERYHAWCTTHPAVPDKEVQT